MKQQLEVYILLLQLNGTRYRNLHWLMHLENNSYSVGSYQIPLTSNFHMAFHERTIVVSTQVSYLSTAHCNWADYHLGCFKKSQAVFLLYGIAVTD